MRESGLDRHIYIYIYMAHAAQSRELSRMEYVSDRYRAQRADVGLSIFRADQFGNVLALVEANSQSDEIIKQYK